MSDTFYLVNQIADTLFEPEQRRLAMQVTDLVTRNCEIRKVASGCFVHNGEIFLATGQPMPERGNRPFIDYSLLDDVRDFIAQRSASSLLKNQISQLITKLIESCTELRDVRNALPECLVEMLPDLAPFPRTNEPAYTLAGDPRAERQYAKLLPRIQALAIGRLLY